MVGPEACFEVSTSRTPSRCRHSTRSRRSPAGSGGRSAARRALLRLYGIVGQNVRLALSGPTVRVSNVVAGVGGRAITTACGCN
jgi:hypothetical protein